MQDCEATKHTLNDFSVFGTNADRVVAFNFNSMFCHRSWHSLHRTCLSLESWGSIVVVVCPAPGSGWQSHRGRVSVQRLLLVLQSHRHGKLVCIDNHFGYYFGELSPLCRCLCRLSGPFSLQPLRHMRICHSSRTLATNSTDGFKITSIWWPHYRVWSQFMIFVE